MDPLTLATAAVTALAPYLLKAAGKAAEKVGENAVSAAGRLFEFVRGSLDGQPAAEALADAQKAPDDADALGALRIQLRKRAEKDVAFRAELERLLADPALAETVRAAQRSVVTGDLNKVAQVAGSGNSVKL